MQNMAAAPKQQERASGVIRQEKLAPLDIRLEKLGLVRDWGLLRFTSRFAMRTRRASHPSARSP